MDKKGEAMKLGLLFYLLITLLACGASGADDDNATDDNSITVINTEKLIGTPMEGMTTGDDISWSLFREGIYQTTTIDSVPMPVFLAFFTNNEEDIVKEGIAIANAGVGYEAFQVIDTWQDDARLIYKVDEISDPDYLDGKVLSAGGKARSNSTHYEGKSFADLMSVDWQIEIRSDNVNKWTVAHELGHAFGIQSHAKIDYENDTIIDLEDNSLMSPALTGEGDPVLTDYNFMMQIQGELLLRNLGNTGVPVETS